MIVYPNTYSTAMKKQNDESAVCFCGEDKITIQGCSHNLRNLFTATAARKEATILKNVTKMTRRNYFHFNTEYFLLNLCLLMILLTTCGFEI